MRHENKNTDVYQNKIIIRKYSSKDRQAIRKLCCDTAYFGEPCEAFFSDRELLADLVMEYNTDYEPQHTWVAEYRGEIVGYISACFDEVRYNRIMLFKIIPIGLMRAVVRGEIWSKKTYEMIICSIKSFFLKEGKFVGIDSKKFTAHIHQNMKKGFRSKGTGSRLVVALLEEAARKKVRGIKFRTLRQKPRFPFFEKYDFKQYNCKRIVSWETWLRKSPLFFMEYGKNLP